MSILRTIAAWGLCLAWMSAPVAQARVVSAHAIPVAPWSFPETPGQGVVPEYLKAMAEAAGMPIEVQTIPYLRVMQGMKDGSTELTMLIPDDSRDAVGMRLCVLTHLQAGVVYKYSRYPKLLESGDLASKRVGVPRGSNALDQLHAATRFERYPIESVEQGLRMLALDRLDATYVPSPGREMLLQQARLSPDEYRFLEVTTHPLVLYVSRRSALAKESEKLAQLRQLCEGVLRKTMEQLIQRYR
ncbi:substrate-binding periplasmic protein [Parachitinimonas caeni]|uniref:Transporter substrate-binding domain-containing protein n=1 Tax=Parachitinimonas caeni TaxID=3031301 RepID=A0ABT7DUY1_9NEIS|nr:transporter substrate-binding domain-containing protein [Parachitinimonas caeni]MDK2122935.1 transporter substrate-binding domain-containing protein [Parachitinimonas caeni]